MLLMIHQPRPVHREDDQIPVAVVVVVVVVVVVAPLVVAAILVAVNTVDDL